MYDRLLQKIKAGTPVDVRYLRFLKPDYALLLDLKKAMPGTYRHCVMVGSMAASAAAKIGANPDLTRCMAYYHDIGKIYNPDLYMEANTGARGLMKELKSEEELRLILAHPGNSGQILIQHGFPSEVCAAVAEHHGNIRTRLKVSPEVRQQLLPGELHYPGPRPRSKESAIVMLADSVEAVLNRLRLSQEWPVNPSREFIREVIQTVGAELRAESQFSDAPFNLEEQQTVAGSIMWWMYRFYHKLNVVRTPY